MGLIESYTLDLYCDHPEAQSDACTEWLGQFTGSTKGTVKAAARRKGWKFKPAYPIGSETLGSQFSGACYCPIHAWDIPKIKMLNDD